MPKKKQNLKYTYQMSEQCRRPIENQEKFLLWVNKHFRNRTPALDEIMTAMLKRGGELKGLVELDLKKAAMKHWRSEAQYYRRHVEVTVIDVEIGKQIGEPVRAFIPIERGQYGRIPEENYIPTKRIANDPSLRVSVVEQARRDFLAWLARYERYNEFFQVFSPVVDAFRRLEQRISKDEDKRGKKAKAS